MSKGSICQCCDKQKSPFHMNNKLVCFRCDELLFDIEIECEENPTQARGDYLMTVVPTETTVDKKAA